MVEAFPEGDEAETDDRRLEACPTCRLEACPTGHA
jgi:hypothetical protein